MSRLATQLTTLALDAMPASLTVGEREATIAASKALAPTPALALELRLGAAGGPIDLSQPFTRDADGPALLAALAAAMPGAGWERLRDLAAWWDGIDGESLNTLWLERDTRGAAAPSVFLELAAPITGNAAERALLARLTAVDDALWAAVRAALAAADALGLARSPLLGLMLSRAGALRLTFPDPGARVAPLLNAIGWPGDAATVAALLAANAARTCRHRVVVDLAPDPLPHIGIEFVFDGPHQRDLFAGVLDWFEARGWATSAARAFLAGWAGLVPPQADGWPDALIVAGILGRPANDTWLRRRTNHLKLVIDAAGAIDAKAYFGLQLPGMRV